MDGSTKSWPRKMADMGNDRAAIFAFATAHCNLQWTRPSASLWWG